MSKFSLTHLSLWEGSPLCPLPKWCPYAVGIGSPPQMAARPQQECWGASTAQCPSRIVQAHLILLHFTDTAFLKKKKNWKSLATLHPVSLSVPFFQQHLLHRLCVSVSHFGNSLSPSTFFFTYTFVRWSVIVDVTLAKRLTEGSLNG